ncbi:SgcJ/EcaC family oxidoreductase [Streptomyces sp. NPDC058000]|uniref:SgcJ/EcaC family oxidoreductase n=1 Tax=Streptomyces sp. NPDC058000 TaxID=3346299 RepID=UPI0036EE3EBB
MADHPYTPTPHNDDTRAITNLFNQLETAFAAHDATQFDQHFTHDVIFTAVNGMRLIGWKALHTYHRERLEQHAQDIQTRYEIEHITYPSPHIAIVFLRQPITTPHHQQENLGTWILTKQNNQWHITAGQNTHNTHNTTT